MPCSTLTNFPKAMFPCRQEGWVPLTPVRNPSKIQCEIRNIIKELTSNFQNDRSVKNNYLKKNKQIKQKIGKNFPPKIRAPWASLGKPGWREKMCSFRSSSSITCRARLFYETNACLKLDSLRPPF